MTNRTGSVKYVLCTERCLPVLLVMISNHYAGTYGHRYNWLILVALSAAGALVRVWFVARHKGTPSPAPLVAAGVLFAAVLAGLAPQPTASSRAGAQGAPVVADESDASIVKSLRSRWSTSRSSSRRVSGPAPGCISRR